MMKRWLMLAAVVMAGCTKIQDKPVLDTISPESWRVVVSTRQIPLQVGSNAFVVAIQSPDRAWVRPNEVQVSMTMTPRDTTTPPGEPQTVSLQPDGQNGHYLAIVDLRKADVWDSELAIHHRGHDHQISFALSNHPH